MEEQADNLTGVPEPVPPRNRGWFRPGDPRVNREGRPRGSKAATGQAVDRAPRADRLVLLWVPAWELAFRLTHGLAPWWTVNLPKGFRIVGSRVDAARDAVALVIRSQTFPRVARGAPIPEFEPELKFDEWLREQLAARLAGEASPPAGADPGGGRTE
jgi:hypothetical protein